MYKVTYIHHSGFMVETEEYCFIFDYYAKNGIIEDIGEKALEQKKVLVFASHFHPDHFDKSIFELRKWSNTIHFILSDDIRVKKEWANEDIVMVGPEKAYVVAGVNIRTLRSNDSGVAFLLDAKGTCFYHAGDLNWWHWNGEPDTYNQDMKNSYQAQIDTLSSQKIDAAFIVLDPRLEEKYLLGLDYIMRHVNIVHAFPMHVWENFGIYEAMAADSRAKAYLDRVVRISAPGESFIME